MYFSAHPTTSNRWFNSWFARWYQAFGIIRSFIRRKIGKTCKLQFTFYQINIAAMKSTTVYQLDINVAQWNEICQTMKFSLLQRRIFHFSLRKYMFIVLIYSLNERYSLIRITIPDMIQFIPVFLLRLSQSDKYGREAAIFTKMHS